MANLRPYRAYAYDNENRPFIDGPSDGCNRDGGTLFPYTRFPTLVAAEDGARIANDAYAAGYAKAQADMRLALGLDP